MPPQKITTFTGFPLSDAALGRRVALRPARCAQKLFQPALVAEMPVLLRAQPIGDPPFGQLDVVVCEDLVLRDAALQLAAFDQPLRQIAPRAHLVGVHRLAVGHVHPVLVEHLARLATAQTSTIGPPSGGASSSRKRTTRAIENGVSKWTRW